METGELKVHVGSNPTPSARGVPGSPAGCVAPAERLLSGMIAFLGMGLLGSNFVRALLERGETVQVWNRTAEKARALEVDGAVAFDDPADTVRGATRVHLALSDDAAVDAALERAWSGFGDGTVVVDHTTTSVDGTRERVRRWQERGIAFQHAPVFMGPVNAREGTGWILASGDRDRFEALEPELARMTGAVKYLGPRPERAAAFKLMGNLFLIEMTRGLMEMFSLARAVDVDVDEAASLFDWLDLGASVPARVRRVLDADYERPSWALGMARKDVRLMIEAAERSGVSLPALSAIAREMDVWVENGHGHADWTVIASDIIGRGD